MIFIDSNIPMYLVGAPHPNKEAARAAMERIIARGERMVTSVEVMQEILHRYHMARQHETIQPCLNTLLGFVDEVYPIERDDVFRARDVLLGTKGISSRDALHVAVMQRHGIGRVMSFDRGFDAVATVERVC